jgi:hypothetical protein
MGAGLRPAKAFSFFVVVRSTITKKLPFNQTLFYTITQHLNPPINILRYLQPQQLRH